MSSFNMSNGASRGSYGGYDGKNDNGSMMSYQEEYAPQIYRVRSPTSTLSQGLHTYNIKLGRLLECPCV